MTIPSDYERHMLTLINSARSKVGAKPLAFNDNLNDAAALHSQWMLANDKFSHTGADGSTAGTRMKAAGYVFSGSWLWGENISWCSLRGAADYMDEVELLHANLMNSPGHKANILNPNFVEIGLGFEVGQFGTYQGAFVTQDFAKSSGSIPAPTPVPTPSAKLTARGQGADIFLTSGQSVMATLSIDDIRGMTVKEVVDYVVAAVNGRGSL